jgi:hypothetical protein
MTTTIPSGLTGPSHIEESLMSKVLAIRLPDGRVVSTYEEIEGYLSLNGKVYETKDEVIRADKLYAIQKIIPKGKQGGAYFKVLNDVIDYFELIKAEFQSIEEKHNAEV